MSDYTRLALVVSDAPRAQEAADDHFRNIADWVPLDQADAKRQRAVLPDAGLSIELRRVEGLDPALLPNWLAAAIAGEAAV